MAEYNERKLQVLQYVRGHSGAMSADLASALNLEVHNARTLLKKYRDQGLLSRRKIDPFGTRAYEITEKGLRRLKWLRGEEFSPEVEKPLTISEPEKETTPAPIVVEKATPTESLKRFIKFLEKFEEFRARATP